MMGSYANDITSPEVEVGTDITGGGIFADSKSRHADLKSMLDSNKDNIKMEAMKRIINMMAKGRDVSELFPAVVKNVAGKNLEVKKLVYVYLVRYAEEQQDLALLSISTFQRGLKDPNQLIRASALRVLSSIRVPMIAPILMLSVKESMRDMSPYVRKVAAHAIPKLYSLDPEHKEQLVEVIDYLLADKTTLVVGSAMYAFAEVCSERLELLHKHYRKLCQVLMDVDEWGQVIIVNTLTRYARTYFVDPNAAESDDKDQNGEKAFFSESEEKSGSESDSADEDKKEKDKPYEMEPDLRLLLRNTKALLQSRNSAVVLAVAALYYHVAPRAELSVIGRALVRLLRAPREVQSVVLMNIATISAKRRNMFEPFLKSFFVRWNDPTYIKLLKVEVLTNLATQMNITIILREFQTYVQSSDKEFAARTIDAIGRCAANIEEVADVCMNGLVALMSSKNETVVAQSVVVIKRLMQLQSAPPKDILIKMSRLLDSVGVPAARASIVWLTGEYCKEVPTVAPDVLRRMAKTFCNEADVVRLQVLNLTVKLLITNREQTELLAEYVFKLARYDNSYDVRDRARFLRNFVFEPQNDPDGKLAAMVEKVFLSSKPAPVPESLFKDRDEFQLGTLSHYLHQRCTGYEHLPDFAVEQLEPAVRDVDGFLTPSTDFGASEAPSLAGGHISTGGKQDAKRALDNFYSDQTSSSAEDEASSDVSDSSSSGEQTSSAESEESSDSGSNASESEKETENVKPKSLPNAGKIATEKKTLDGHKLRGKKAEKSDKKAAQADLLLDLDFGDDQGPVAGAVPPAAATAHPLPTTSPTKKPAPPVQESVAEMPTAPAQLVPSDTVELLSKMNGGGVAAHGKFTRAPSLFASDMVAMEMVWRNDSSIDVKQVLLSVNKLPSGLRVAGLPDSDGEPLAISAGATRTITIGVNFADGTQTIELHAAITWDEDSSSSSQTTHTLPLTAPVGEQLQPVMLGEAQFSTERARLSGLNETSGKFKLKTGMSVKTPAQLHNAIYTVANVIETTVIGERPASEVGQ